MPKIKVDEWGWVNVRLALSVECEEGWVEMIQTEEHRIAADHPLVSALAVRFMEDEVTGPRWEPHRDVDLLVDPLFGRLDEMLLELFPE